MSSPKVEIRTLNTGDLPAVSELHRLVFPTRALSRLGPQAIERFYDWVMNGPHPVVYPLGAWQANQLVGFLFSGEWAINRAEVYDMNVHIGFLRKNALFLALCVLRQPGMLFDAIVGAQARIAWNLLLRRKNGKGGIASEPPAYLPEIAIKELDRYKTRFGLLSLAVHPEFRGLSALILVRKTEDFARERGYDEVIAYIHPDSEYNYKFYHMQGYQPFGDWSGNYGGLVKALGQSSPASQE